MTASDPPDIQAEEALLIEAAAMVPLVSAYPGPQRRQAFEAWCARSPAHRAAGEAAERMLQVYAQRTYVATDPGEVSHRPRRRRWLRLMAAVAVLAAIATISWYALPWKEWMADYHTGIGARREVALQDGSVLVLNTDSSVAVQFDATRRAIALTHGEISVRVAADRALAVRPFTVTTAQGQIEAAGSYFSVRQDEGSTHVAVLSGAANITDKSPGSTAPKILLGGKQVSFGPAAADTAVRPADNRVLAWTHGLLIAQDMSLGDVVADLTRYRRGVVRCAPDVCDLKVSGVYPVEDTDRVLGTLQATYPVKIRYLTRYWVELVAR